MNTSEIKIGSKVRVSYTNSGNHYIVTAIEGACAVCKMANNPHDLVDDFNVRIFPLVHLVAA